MLLHLVRLKSMMQLPRKRLLTQALVPLQIQRLRLTQRALSGSSRAATARPIFCRNSREVLSSHGVDHLHSQRTMQARQRSRARMRLVHCMHPESSPINQSVFARSKLRQLLRSLVWAPMVLPAVSGSEFQVPFTDSIRRMPLNLGMRISTLHTKSTLWKPSDEMPRNSLRKLNQHMQ